MYGPGEYSPGEQKFINWLGIFALALVLTGMFGLLWKCFHADFTGREDHTSQTDTAK